MTSDHPRDPSVKRRWANLRFSIIGPLLAAPPEHGELQAKLCELAARRYRHPTTGEPVCYSVKTLERWYYAAKSAADPVAALARKVPSHAGSFPAMPARLGAALEIQWREHPSWSMQLHADNLRALVREDPSLGPMPSYTTVCRFMKDRGFLRHKRKKRRASILEPGRRRGRAGGDAARDAELRAAPRAWALAPGFPSGLAQGADPGR